MTWPPPRPGMVLDGITWVEPGTEGGQRGHLDAPAAWDTADWRRWATPDQLAAEVARQAPVLGQQALL